MSVLNQVTELKAQNFEAEKVMRGKVQSLQKEHNQTVEGLQVRRTSRVVSRLCCRWIIALFNFLQAKIRDLQRQVASLSKSNRKAEKSLERVASSSQLDRVASSSNLERVASSSQLQQLQLRLESQEAVDELPDSSNQPVTSSDFS